MATDNIVKSNGQITDSDRLEALIKADEGLRLKPYKDHKGHLTIGYGHNLDANGISPRVAEMLFLEDLNDALADIHDDYPWILAQAPARIAVVVSMRFQLGSFGLKKWPRFLTALRYGDYDRASRELLDSAVARDPLTRPRYERFARMVATGEWLS